jgi:hypothetical protein
MIALKSFSLKALRIRFNLDFAGYVDNLLAPERRAKNPSSSDIINGFSLDNDDINHKGYYSFFLFVDIRVIISCFKYDTDTPSSCLCIMVITNI